MASRSLAKCSHDHHLLLQQSQNPTSQFQSLLPVRALIPLLLCCCLSVRPSVLLRCRSSILATILAADPVLSLLLSALSINQSIKQQQQQKTSTVAAEQIPSDFSSTTRQTAASCSLRLLSSFCSCSSNSSAITEEERCSAAATATGFSSLFFCYFSSWVICRLQEETDRRTQRTQARQRARPPARPRGGSCVSLPTRAPSESAGAQPRTGSPVPPSPRHPSVTWSQATKDRTPRFDLAAFNLI